MLMIFFYDKPHWISQIPYRPVWRDRLRGNQFYQVLYPCQLKHFWTGMKCKKCHFFSFFYHNKGGDRIFEPPGTFNLPPLKHITSIQVILSMVEDWKSRVVQRCDPLLYCGKKMKKNDIFYISYPFKNVSTDRDTKPGRIDFP
jgi:hypothetical protein